MAGTESQRYHREMEPNLNAGVTGGFIKSVIWLRNFFSNWKLSARLQHVMTNWRLLIWALFALPQSWFG